MQQQQLCRVCWGQQQQQQQHIQQRWRQPQDSRPRWRPLWASKQPVVAALRSVPPSQQQLEVVVVVWLVCRRLGVRGSV